MGGVPGDLPFGSCSYGSQSKLAMQGLWFCQNAQSPNSTLNTLLERRSKELLTVHLKMENLNKIMGSQSLLPPSVSLVSPCCGLVVSVARR